MASNLSVARLNFFLRRCTMPTGRANPGALSFTATRRPPFDLRLHGARRQDADSLPQRHRFLDHLDVVEVHDEVDLDPLRA